MNDRAQSAPRLPSFSPDARDSLAEQSTAASAAQLEQLRLVHLEQATQSAILRSMRRLMATTLVLVLALAAFVVANTMTTNTQLTALERRIERLEKTVFQLETP